MLQIFHYLPGFQSCQVVFSPDFWLPSTVVTVVCRQILSTFNGLRFFHFPQSPSILVDASATKNGHPFHGFLMRHLSKEPTGSCGTTAFAAVETHPGVGRTKKLRRSATKQKKKHKKTMIEIKKHKKISVGAGGIQKQQGGFSENSCFHKCKKKRIAALPAALCQPVPEPWKLRNLSENIETWNHLRNPANLSEPSKPPTTSCRNPSKPGTVEPGSFPEPPHLAQNTSKSIVCKKTIAFCCWGTIVCCSANLNEVTIRLWDCFPVKKKQWKVEVAIDPLHKNELL